MDTALQQDQYFPLGFWDLLPVAFIERSQLEMKAHAHTNTHTHEEERGLEMLIQTHRREGGVNPVLIVNSARWLYCAAVSPFIQLSCHPSWLWH